ncbi:hypothetical protein OJP23_03190, partial [Campylobacter lari]|nr:hypothetical protein [Campylobacter lari]
MKEVHSKRLAIHLYGHVRTYEKTYKNFYKNIIETNKKDGWEIDIFMHTWDVFSITDHNAWHAKDNLFPTMTGKKLTSSDKHRIVEIYQPKRYIIDPNPNKPAGRFESIKKAMNLRKEYEKDMRITYDYYLTTRPDLLFLKPLRINEYINLYNIQRNLINIGFPDKINFCSCWCFRYPYYLPILDPRFPNESDLLWFGNYCSNKGFDPLIAYREEPNAVNVFIQYRLNMDFIQYREATKSVDYLIFISNSKNEFYINQLNLQTNLDKTIKEKDSIIKSNINHINQLQS